MTSIIPHENVCCVITNENFDNSTLPISTPVSIKSTSVYPILFKAQIEELELIGENTYIITDNLVVSRIENRSKCLYNCAGKLFYLSCTVCCMAGVYGLAVYTCGV
jgi:hypothetical protein